MPFKDILSITRPILAITVTAMSLLVAAITCASTDTDTSDPLNNDRGADIADMYTTSLNSLDILKAEIVEQERKRRLEEKQAEIKDFYDLAAKMEERGDLIKAAKCYKEIINMAEEDPSLLDFIAEKNKELRLMADAQKDLAEDRLAASDEKVSSYSDTSAPSSNPYKEQITYVHKLKQRLLELGYGRGSTVSGQDESNSYKGYKGYGAQHKNYEGYKGYYE
ncbi:MAG: hypothetical protein PHH49_04645 [Candidatus Omnitrophica bacterium]|nr:hypothetical protein [Candidatus Omnitrophota bacterium]MDD5488236.1 hypothetical protein [Candidatus Omnitrophota bacterium]